MNQREKTRELLIKHFRDFPKLQIKDVFKFLFQSAFGCEHLVTSLSKATEYICEEFNNLNPQDNSGIEPLDGDYCRVPLSYLKGGISTKTFAKLFYYSAKKEEKGLLALTQKIEVARELVNEKLLAFSKEDFENAVEQWKAEGYPAIHHSQIFKEAYNPSYRVISKKYVPFLPLFSQLDKCSANKRVIVAIEGGSASGKTTLSEMLQQFYGCTIFHMDDFFLRPEQRTPERYAEIGGNIDRERFLEEVLQPLYKGEDVNYRRFDCSTMTLAKAEHIIPQNLIIVEGAYSMHPEFEKFYDFSVFLNISSELQKSRILKRNSSEFSERFFNEWIPLEQKYFSNMSILEKCNMKIDITEQ